MRVAITGGTGLIGAGVLARFMARGDDIRVLALPETVNALPRAGRLSTVAGSVNGRTRWSQP